MLVLVLIIPAKTWYSITEVWTKFVKTMEPLGAGLLGWLRTETPSLGTGVQAETFHHVRVFGKW